ncbi:MAG: hypothetical protein MJ236_06365 [Clostridia bacterium]|nr:hypothetical protein [Clostridia bacterium]
MKKILSLLLAASLLAGCQGAQKGDVSTVKNDSNIPFVFEMDTDEVSLNGVEIVQETETEYHAVLEVTNKTDKDIYYFCGEDYPEDQKDDVTIKAGQTVEYIQGAKQEEDGTFTVNIYLDLSSTFRNQSMDTTVRSIEGDVHYDPNKSVATPNNLRTWSPKDDFKDELESKTNVLMDEQNFKIVHTETAGQDTLTFTNLSNHRVMILPSHIELGPGEEATIDAVKMEGYTVLDLDDVEDIGKASLEDYNTSNDYGYVDGGGTEWRYKQIARINGLQLEQ